jgi:hypothetical protein
MALALASAGCAIGTEDATTQDPSSEATSEPAFQKFYPAQPQRDRSDSVSPKILTQKATLTNDRALPDSPPVRVPDLVIDRPGVIPE